MQLESIVVIGSGTMGQSIAQWFAQRGKNVTLYDPFEDSLNNAQDRILMSWDKLCKKGKFTAKEIQDFTRSIEFCSLQESCPKAADLIIEAIPENLKIKQNVFHQAHQYFDKNTIFASNTSSISIDKLSQKLPFNRKNKFIGIHFFNPATIMKLIEIIPSVDANPEVISFLKDALEAEGKAVTICRNSPGFIVNRVARNFYGEALRIAKYDSEERFKEIDQTLKEVGGFKMGPFELMDLIGIDVNLNVTETVWKGFYQEPRFTPHPIQRNKVEAGKLGKKTEMGFYNWGNK